jgi:hypothetical protein
LKAAGDLAAADSILIPRENMQALIRAWGIKEEARQVGGPEKF